MNRRWQLVASGLILMACMAGCARSARDLSLDPELARASLQRAMQAWSEGKKPADLRPEIIMGDHAWDKGVKLVSFTIQTAEERSDGTNLYLPVLREFKDDRGKTSRSTTTYIVGTSPSITIFPQ
jgi:hypothetical protein